MADAQMPKLKGKVLDGKPACNSKSLIVALSDDKTPEVTLVLDTPVKGKPAPASISPGKAPSPRLTRQLRST